MLKTSYHNHSTWSDGKSSPEEMFLAAKASGLAEFGLSDHLALPPDDKYGVESWSVKLEQVNKYVDECLLWKKRLDDENFTIRLGIEIDFFEESHDKVIGHLSLFPFDYLIGAIHFLDRFPIDHYPEPWQALSPEQVDETWNGYWRKTQKLIKTGDFDFLAHIDLPKKFNFLPSEFFSPELEATLLALRDSDMPIEINTAGWAKPCAESYPGLPLLQRAKQLGIPTLVNADAHRPEDIMQFFPQAEQMLRKCGYQKVCQFKQRKKQLVDV